MFISIRIKKAAAIISCAALAVMIGAGIFLHHGQAQEETVTGLRLPIIMYHSISRDEARLGEYVVTPQQFESDIIYLKQQGYEPVFVNELIMHLRYGSKLPDKPVIITLDDGHLNALTQALPICRRQGFKMTVSCVAKWSEIAAEEAQPDENYSYCDAKDINTLRESGLCEIACHSYDMHSLGTRRGILKTDEESEELYISHLLNDISKAEGYFEKHCGFRPNVYCYPYGFNDKLSRSTVRSGGFEATLGTEEGINVITDESSLFELKRFNRPNGQTSEEFFKDKLP